MADTPKTKDAPVQFIRPGVADSSAAAVATGSGPSAWSPPKRPQPDEKAQPAKD